MQADRERFKDLFEQLCALDPPERNTLLAKESPEVRLELESLLKSLESAGDFLESPAQLQETLAGERVGAYRLVRQIGQGGMGAVYEAIRADREFDQRVAIKLVRLGLDSDFLRQRFRGERQILARLSHPNIAALLDGGTTRDGRPFLVMEYVEGVPILSYCESHSLRIRERLKLFRSVCEAVQFAHRHLIVHRDLKPGNILVTPEGVPKLLDFGIAKALEAGEGTAPAEASVTGLLMTPEYASPEQILRGPITTATDIYSLGVVLFELLTSAKPYAITTGSPHEISRQICEHPPIHPSAAAPEALRSTLAGDLDRIILKALRKEPEQRYASAEQFAADIDRYLQGLPVLARTQTLRYRAAKFVRRRKGALATALLVVLIAGGGLGSFLWKAEQERRRFNDLRHLANSLLFEIYDSIRTVPGTTDSRRLVVARAQEYLDSLSRESSRDASLQSELANSYERLGDVQGGFQGVNLGDPRGAAASYTKALAIRTAMRQGDASRRDLIRSHGKLSDLLFQEGRFDESLTHLHAAVDIAGQLAAAHPDNRVDQRNLAVSLLDYGYKQAIQGDWQTGLASMRKSAAVLEGLAASDPSDRQVRRILALTYGREGELLEKKAVQLGAALQAHLKQTAILQDMVQRDSGNSDLRRLLGWSMLGQGTALLLLGRYNESASANRAAMDVFADLIGTDSKDAQSRCDIGFAEFGMAQAYFAMAKPREARHWAQEAVNALQFGRDKGLISPQDRGIPDEAGLLLEKIEAAR
jgi:tRNA A-37 threonylcarbamoyl transferase component Bud32/tetratricopeptide (TPR) repeat protein